MRIAFTGGRDLTIKYMLTTSLEQTDALSRLINSNWPISEDYVVKAIAIEGEEKLVMLDSINAFPVTVNMVQDSKKLGYGLKQVAKYVHDGWPNESHNGLIEYLRQRGIVPITN
ncbi:unnamed protein product [Schistosoma curassoni]|uniref:Phage protein n=1 Tax=Schistosoma curassoni TaxID=6186 RepID=A0A183JXI6_9TREM|nr:unnamed protein product [Schistosoma curassoni]